MCKLFSQVSEVREIKDIEKVNQLIKENWILLNIVQTTTGIKFSMGKLS